MKDVHGVGLQGWSDGKRKRLETCLNSFVRALIRASEAIEQQRLEAEAQGKGSAVVGLTCALAAGEEERVSQPDTQKVPQARSLSIKAHQ